MPTPPRVLLGDGTPCELAPDVLDGLAEAVVFAAQMGRRYGEARSTDAQSAVALDKAAAIRADLQRLLRETQLAMQRTSGGTQWPEVRQFSDVTEATLQTAVEGQQANATRDAERMQRELRIQREDIGQHMRRELCAFLLRRARTSPTAMVRRRHDERGAIDRLSADLAKTLHIEFESTQAVQEPAPRLAAYVKKCVVHVGTRRALFRGEVVRKMKLHDLFVVEAVLGETAVDVRLARKLKPGGDVFLLRLRNHEKGLSGQLTLNPDEHINLPFEDDAVLRALWDALQRERKRVLTTTLKVTRIELDHAKVDAPRGYLACGELLMEPWRRIVTQLRTHTPGPEELSIRVQPQEGPEEELWVRTADLTQHLLSIPPGYRGRLGPTELLGPANVTMESDLIDLGRIQTPDAGGDSDVIALEYISPNPEPGVPAATPHVVMELLTDDIQLLDVSPDPEEKSGCYDLSKLARPSTGTNRAITVPGQPRSRL